MKTPIKIVEESRINSITEADFRDAIRDLNARLAHYATKAELEHLKQNTLNWMITLGISLAALQIFLLLLFFQLYLPSH